MRQGYTNIQIEGILVANNLPRNRKLIQERRKIVESDVPGPRTTGASTVPTITAPAIIGAARVQQPRTMGAGNGAINPQNTGNLDAVTSIVAPIAPPSSTGADRVQIPNPSTVPSTAPPSGTSNPPQNETFSNGSGTTPNHNDQVGHLARTRSDTLPDHVGIDAELPPELAQKPIGHVTATPLPEHGCHQTISPFLESLEIRFEPA